MPVRKVFIAVLSIALAGACDPGQPPEPEEVMRPAIPEAARVTEHRNGDDLLSAGLGLEGLRDSTPVFGDPLAPTPSELRRQAIHAQWQALIDLSPAGGFGRAWGSLPRVPGQEFHVLDRLNGLEHPFRILLQLPDAFDPDKPCLVAAPASGSRGVYGAVPVVGPVAFEHGCAVVHTDKGAGTDIFDFQSRTGVGLDGTRLERSTGPLAFEPLPVSGRAPDGLVALKHGHSADNPEAHWGAMVVRSLEFGRSILAAEYPEMELAALTTLAMGLSNGGGAVLQAAADDSRGLLDGIVAVAPNIRAPGARPLFDYATLAALYQPCMLAGGSDEGWPLHGLPALVQAGELRCQALADAGRLDEPDPVAARRILAEAGFDDPALSQAGLLAMGDLWRSVAVLYASAYARSAAADMPCDFALVSAASEAERNQWYALSAGVAPGAGIEIRDGRANGPDAAFAGLLCLRELYEEETDPMMESLAAIESLPAPEGPPTVVVHGLQDGLIPEVFSAGPWVAAARDNGHEALAYWRVDGAQHFDSVLGMPGVQGRYAPLQAYTEAAFEALWSHLRGDDDFPGDRLIRVAHPGPGQELEASHLGLTASR